MKTHSFNILLAGLLFLNVAVLTSCKDDDNLYDPSIPTVTSDETVFVRTNRFYDLDVSGNDDWKVEYTPEWVGAMNNEGKAGEPLQIFVDENDDDLDRCDTIVVSIVDKSLVRIPVRQYGKARDDNNDGVILLDSREMKKTYGVGYSTDVIKKNSSNAMKYYVLDRSPFKFANLLAAMKELGEADAAVSEPLFSSRYESVTGTSTSAISSQLGVNAGIDVGIKAFKFSVEAGYSTSSSSDDRYMYAMQEIQHIVGSRYLRAGMLRYLAMTDPTIFQSKFGELVNGFRASRDSSAMGKIVSNYGTHIIVRGTLGGELKVSMQMKITDQTDASSIHAALGLSSKVVKADGSFDMSNKDSTIAQNTTLSLQSYGGNNVYSIPPGTTFQGFQMEVKDPDKMSKWVSSIKGLTSLALIDMETIPIWDLMPTEGLRDSLRTYVVDVYQRQIFKANGEIFKPNLYVVKGYEVGDAPGYGSTKLQEVDIEIQAESAIIPELDPNEFSTVIYSGPIGNVNRSRGFFVGSPTRKPCKFYRKKDGTFQTEVFDRLTEGAITELYVDVTGDVTIAPKSVTELYETCNITNWKNDISTLTKDWTAKSDITITGTTNHSSAIADGVTLTLDAVTVNNEIKCEGNATIVLKDSTENVVNCPNDEKAGIRVGPVGNTLTLQGNGTLKAQGGKYSAGIGSCHNGRCGDIIITGGSITATGGVDAAGIGSGCVADCGDITIKSTVISVEAIKGSDKAESIGAGYSGSCGTVTIEAGDKVVQK